MAGGFVRSRIAGTWSHAETTTCWTSLLVVVGCPRLSWTVTKRCGSPCRAGDLALDNDTDEAHLRRMGISVSTASSAQAGVNGSAESAAPLGMPLVVVTHHHSVLAGVLHGGADSAPPWQWVRWNGPVDSTEPFGGEDSSPPRDRLVRSIPANRLIAFPQVATVVPNRHHREQSPLAGYFLHIATGSARGHVPGRGATVRRNGLGLRVAPAQHQRAQRPCFRAVGR